MTPPHIIISAGELAQGGFLTVRQVHERTGLEIATLRDYLTVGRFTRYKLEHTEAVFLSLAEVEAWEKKRNRYDNL